MVSGRLSTCSASFVFVGGGGDGIFCVWKEEVFLRPCVCVVCACVCGVGECTRGCF